MRAALFLGLCFVAEGIRKDIFEDIGLFPLGLFVVFLAMDIVELVH